MRAAPALRRAAVAFAVVTALAIPGLSPLSAGATVTASTPSARAASAPTPTSTAAPVEVYPPDTQQDPVRTAIKPLQVTGQDSTADAVLTFSASGLPTGLAISSAGLISGTPTTGGQYSVTVTATDQNGASGSASFTWDAYGTITISAPPETTVGVGFPVSVQITALDSVPGQTLTFRQVPSGFPSGPIAPPGLSVSPSGLITGSILRQPASGWYMLFVTATDGLGASSEYDLQFQALLGPGPAEAGPVKSAVAGKCLDDTGSGTADNNPVQLYSCNGDAAQQWAVDGSEITDFGKCLSTVNGGTAIGAGAVLYDCNTGNFAINVAESWSSAGAELTDDGSQRCLDDPNASQANGVKLQVWSCNGRIQQNWTLPSGPMNSAIPGMCAEGSGASAANGAQVQIWSCNGQKSQQWTAEPDNTIRVQGKCLDIVNKGTSNGSKLQLWSCSDTSNQLWFTLPDGQIANVGTGRCLDDPSASSKDGTQLQIWDCNGGTQQSWRVP
jgi:hypothetical protein